MRLASGAEPVFTPMKPPASTMRSKGDRSTTRSLMTGNDDRAPRFDHQMVAVGELAHVQLAGCGGLLGSVGLAVHHHATGSADALAAVARKLDRLVALGDERLVDDIEHLEERHVLGDVVGLVTHETAVGVGPGLTPDIEGHTDRCFHNGSYL